MCGIIGYVGQKEIIPILLNGLKHLEYRGYDSAGIAIEEDGVLKTFRKTGKITGLDTLFQGHHGQSYRGIGHTRWTTHGAPSEENAHPHLDCQ